MSIERVDEIGGSAALVVKFPASVALPPINNEEESDDIGFVWHPASGDCAI